MGGGTPGAFEENDCAAATEVLPGKCYYVTTRGAMVLDLVDYHYK